MSDTATAEIQVYRQWLSDKGLLAALRRSFTYAKGDDRASGFLYVMGGDAWPASLSTRGPLLLQDVSDLVRTPLTMVSFQAYKDGSGCEWHADSGIDVQVILSLGVTRTLRLRSIGGGEETALSLDHGDLIVMPSGFQKMCEHTVPIEDVKGERCAMVFRSALS